MSLFKTKHFVFLLMGAVALAGCKKEDKKDDLVELDRNFSMTFNLVNNGQPYTLGDITSVSTVKTVKFDLFLFYLSHIELIPKDGGAAIKLSEVVFGEMEENQNKATFNFKVPEGNFAAVKFNFGLDEDQNSTDPNSVDLDHPLSSSKGMYWSWAQKYRFVILEGRGHPDANNDLMGSDITLISYHPGADELRRQKIYNKNVTVSKFNKTTLNFDIDISKLFDGSGGSIDLIQENQTHTAPTDYYLAEIFMDNMPGAVSLMAD